MYTCIPPSGLAPPTFLTSNSTSITIQWTPPQSNGGCPITGYAVFRDNGTSEITDIEVNVPNDPSIRNIPVLSQATAILNSSDLGLKFKFEVRAYNREGYVAA